MKKKDKELTQEFDLFYIPDSVQAAKVFLNGFGGVDEKGSEYTFWQSIKDAMKQYDGKADKDGNIKIFSCDVWLSPSQQIDFKQVGFVNIGNPAHIELTYCASVNEMVLKQNGI